MLTQSDLYFYKNSFRYIEPALAGNIISKLPPFVGKTGVFVNQTPDEIIKIIELSGIDTIQIHGEHEFYTPEIITELKSRTPLPVIMAIRTDKFDASSFIEIKELSNKYKGLLSCYLIDKFDKILYGGTGKSISLGPEFSEEFRDFIEQRVILAGGINAGNIINILKNIRPFGIDVSSGLENKDKNKDPDLIREFMKIALCL